MNNDGKYEKVQRSAHAYTPGLKVKKNMIIKKERKLPIPGDVLVEVGEKVSHNKIVAKTSVPGDVDIINAALMLALDPFELMDYMDKKVGDAVKKGEPVASYTAFFGLIKRFALSPLDGFVDSISVISGHVTVREAPKPVEIDAYIPGVIVKTMPKEGVVVETKGSFIQGIFGIGGETHGKIKFLVDAPNKVLTADAISHDDRGYVLVGGSEVTLDALIKSIEIGAAGIIVGGINQLALTKFMGVEIGIAITGEEESNLSLIITEGFGKMNMSNRVFSLLKDYEGYMASINGSTQIRAGVIRPEIIIPHEEIQENSFSSEEISSGMIPGTPVRVIRDPYFGSIGKVVNLPVDLEKIETESYVRILELNLDDGRHVKVPRANVEIIEE